MAKKLKVALVHDYLAEVWRCGTGAGSAACVIQKHQSTLRLLIQIAWASSGSALQDWDIRTSWLTKIPLHKNCLHRFAFCSRSFSAFDLSEYDLVISSTNAYFAKAVKVRDGATHLCYCHTPSRSLWGTPPWLTGKNPLIRVAGELINHYLHVWLMLPSCVNESRRFIANSNKPRCRIEKFYHFTTTVWCL